MIVWVIRGGEIVGYRRLGECLGCGECCSRFGYTCQRAESPKEAKDGEYEDLTRREGWAIEDWDDPNKWQWWGPFEISDREHICECFDSDTKRCGEWGTKEWKEVCRKFPFRPEDLEGLSNCGFRFERLEA